jgi:large conductance mechanosensitive channel
MLAEFKGFLTKSNAMALAIGVIIGAATGKVVTKLVEDLIMPIVGIVLPEGDWRTAVIELPRGKALMYGDFIGAVIDFIFIAFVVFMLGKALLKPEPPGAPTKDCPFCLEKIPQEATKCRACASAV